LPASHQTYTACSDLQLIENEAKINSPFLISCYPKLLVKESFNLS